MFRVSDTWKATYPGAVSGVLIMHDVINPDYNPALEAKKTSLEQELRRDYGELDRPALLDIPPFPAYSDYYKRFKKTYHVFLQYESVVKKGKTIPSVSALVESMFMAELKDRLLTAGHDLDKVQGESHLEIAIGNEVFTTLQGQEKTLKAGDMYIHDDAGVISSVIYGPDQRTQISKTTQKVMFTVYAPPGVGEQPVKRHLEEIRENILLFANQSKTELLRVYLA
jgi:DNA/RNA-binding domain of Phe-tRNA-synthetase-like protein